MSPSHAFFQVASLILPGYAVLEELKVHPIWVMSTSLDDKAKMLSGTIKLEFNWLEKAEQYIPDPRDIVHIRNFASGLGINQMGILALNKVIGGQNVTSKVSTTMYTGNFKQDLEELCYPFDDQTLLIEIELVPPGDQVFDLKLFCVGEISENAKGETVSSHDADVSKCTSIIDENSVGFIWHSQVCEMMGTKILCKRKGHRKSIAPLEVYMFPSIMFIAISFFSFRLGINMSMPRVASSMIALLNLTSLKNSITAKLPQSAELAWLDEYMLVAQIFMFINMTCHIIAFQLEHHGRPAVRQLVDEASLFVVFPVFVTIIVARLHVRECTSEIPSATSGAILGIAVMLLFVSIVTVLYRHRTVFKPAEKLKTETEGDIGSTM